MKINLKYAAQGFKPAIPKTHSNKTAVPSSANTNRTAWHYIQEPIIDYKSYLEEFILDNQWGESDYWD